MSSPPRPPTLARNQPSRSLLQRAAAAIRRSSHIGSPLRSVHSDLPDGYVGSDVQGNLDQEALRESREVAQSRPCLQTPLTARSPSPSNHGSRKNVISWRERMRRTAEPVPEGDRGSPDVNRSSTPLRISSPLAARSRNFSPSANFLDTGRTSPSGVSETPIINEQPHVWKYLAQVMENKARGDLAAANRGYLELNQKLQELPEDSPQKAEILVEGGLSFLVSAQQMAEDIAVANNQASAIIEAAKALPLFKAGLKIQQQNETIDPQLCLWMGQTYVILGPHKFRRANQAFDHGLTHTPAASGIARRIWASKVQLLSRNGDWPGTRSALESMLSLWPNDPALHATLGDTVIKLNITGSTPMETSLEALQHYRRALLLDPANENYQQTVAYLSGQISINADPEREAALPSTGSPLKAPSLSDYGCVLSPSQRMFETVEWSSANRQSPSPSLRSGLTDASSPPTEVSIGEPPNPEELRYRAGSPLASMSLPDAADLPDLPITPPLPTSIPAAYNLPSLDPIARSAVSSPGPVRRKQRVISPTRRAQLFRQAVQAAQNSAAERQQGFEQQLAGFGLAQQANSARVAQVEIDTNTRFQAFGQRFDDHETSSREQFTSIEARLADIELRSQTPMGTSIPRAAAASPMQAPQPARPQTTPPRAYDVATMSQDALLDRSIALYGIWALENKLSS